jgi:hypothetical protein
VAAQAPGSSDEDQDQDQECPFCATPHKARHA